MDKEATRVQGDRHARLMAMGDALQAAAARADWDTLGEHARALGPALRALAARGPWNAAERLVLARLRGQHDAAAAAAATAVQELAARLETMRANKEGWLAYAMHNDIEQGASQE
ncbi:hypothetical protein [Massilia sp. TN1-12]|uniref:hypothetical protein n=1 Tax=Massilia paldalensis TaxID=3377675 RepID=UPI0038516AB0